MFTKEDRRDVDVVEKDFCNFKNQFPEVQEDIVKRLYCTSGNPVHLIDNVILPESINIFRSLSPWGYCFQINRDTCSFELEAKTPFPKEQVPQHPGLVEMNLRLSLLNYIFDHICMDTAQAPKNWLDVATNCGVLPLLLNKQRGLLVTGIDYLNANILKANFLKKLAKDTRCLFLEADAYDFLHHLPDNSVDVISALGIFYHLSDPIGLLSLLYQKTKKFLIIDTIVHHFIFSGWIQTVSRHVKHTELRHANDTRKIIELHPTYRGMIDSLFQVGFSNVTEVVASQDLLEAYPARVYMVKNRTMFVAEK